MQTICGEICIRFSSNVQLCYEVAAFKFLVTLLEFPFRYSRFHPVYIGLLLRIRSKFEGRNESLI